MKATPVGVAAAATPAVFDFVGYHFQAGPLIVGVAGVILSRQIIGLQDGARQRWGFELTVMAFCAFVTALLVQDMRSLLSAGLTGIGIGSLGVGVIGIVKGQIGARLQAAVSALLGTALPGPTAPPADPEPAAPTPRADDKAAIDAAMKTLDQHP